MSIFDAVLCNHALFGEHKGEVHQTHSLTSTFPGDTYEITASGHLVLLVATYEDRSNPDAQGWAQLVGALTMEFTGERRDLNYHGWLELTGSGRAKFTDGKLVAFEPLLTAQGMNQCLET